MCFMYFPLPLDVNKTILLKNYAEFALFIISWTFNSAVLFFVVIISL